MDTDKKLTAQQKIIVDYLSHGRTLTVMVAATCLGIGSLTSRIAELRKLGFKFTTEMEKDPLGRIFKKYKLETAS